MRKIAKVLGGERGFEYMMGGVIAIMIAVGWHLVTTAKALGIPEGGDAAMWCEAKAIEFTAILMLILIGGIILSGLTNLMLWESKTE